MNCRRGDHPRPDILPHLPTELQTQWNHHRIPRW